MRLVHAHPLGRARREPKLRWLTALCSAALWSLAVVSGTALSPLHRVAAQGRVAGLVRDTTGVGIAGAQVTISGSVLRAESDASGKFFLEKVPTGPTTLLVRRLGFAPVSVPVVVRSDSTVPVTVTIAQTARELNPVVVRAQRVRHYTGYLAGFNERRDRGFGRFITGDEIRKRDPLELTDLLRTIPGIHVSASGLGDARVRIRSNQCAPLVWLDGMAAAAAEFDLDALAPMSIAGIEIYSGIATVPAEFVMPFGRTPCGTIIIWSRQGERRPAKAITAAELASLVANLQAYTADQVEEPARADASAPVAPLYPESLYKARVPGRVVVEFVVDSTGEVNMATLGVVSSTDPLFTDAVRRAFPAARFKPARVGARPVAQVVRQPFSFVVPAATP